jgi:hypothetical protein
MDQSTINAIAALVGVAIGSVVPITYVELRDWYKKKRGTYWS